MEQAADDALTAQVRRAVARISMTAPTLWIDDPQQGAVLLAQTGWPALYDLHGDLLAGGPVSANEERLLASEDFVLREVQEVVSTSSALAQGKTTDRPVTIIPNAADVDVFRRPAPRPPDLPQRPVVLVTGMIHRERLDLSLCARTGRALAADGARLVLVGPVFLHASERTLLEAADVLLLGERPYPQMPAYLQAADVLAAPFAANDFTTSLDPVGLYEYAAIGSPVVATTVAQTWEAHRDVVTADGDEFVGAVREALAAGRADGRGPGPDVPTWDERVDQLHSVISRLRGVTSTP